MSDKQSMKFENKVDFLDSSEMDNIVQVMGYLLQPYLSAYYVELDTLNWSALKRAASLSERYPEVNSYIDSLKRYIDNDVYPEDREKAMQLLDVEFIKANLRETTDFSIDFRILSKQEIRYIRAEIVRGADVNHIAVGFMDTTKEILEQQTHLLGAIPLSADILTKAKIGLWAFELDEGQPPRMYVDEAMLRLIGLDHQIPPEDTYHAWYDYIDSDSYGLVAESVEKMTAGEHAEVQYPWHFPDGRTIIVRCGGVRNYAYTKGVRIEGTHQAVTEILRFDKVEAERIRKANELDSVKRTMKMVFALSDEFDPIVIIDPENGNYEWIMRDMDSVDREMAVKLRGDNVYENFLKDANTRLHIEDFENYMNFYTKENLMHVAITGEMCETENRWHLSGEEGFRWKYNKAVRMFDENGKAYVVVGVVDTTEKKEKEEAYRKQQKQIDFQQQKLEEDMQMISGLASEYHALFYFNIRENIFKTYSLDKSKFPKAYKLVNENENPLDAIIKFGRSELVQPEDRHLFENMDIPFVLNGLAHSKRLSVRFRRNFDGVYKWTEMDVVKYEDIDEYPNTIAVGFAERDEMIQKEQEQQQQLAEALSMAESSNRAKTTFLNNMSHDIRTPMNAIIGYTSLAASHIDNKKQVQDYLSKIGQSSNHLLSLINDVLDMSRIESGKMNIEEKTENLPEIIHTLRDIVQHDMHAKQHDFYIDTVNVNDENIVCDKLRLNQVLLNILSNSIKYTSPGGTISMRITEKTVKTNGYAEYEFRIKDNGMGMDKAFLQTIFDPFTRVKSTTVSGIQGTGLGMAITKSIIDMMGGKIVVDSEPGKGTEIIVTFEFKLENAPKLSADIPQLHGIKGIVVDDDYGTCLSVSRMLDDTGMRSEWCTSGKEVIIRAEEAYSKGDPFKVYIIDWLMPDMNGIETTRRIRKVIGEDVPIFILTAYDWSDIEEEACEAGVTAFIGKPIFPSDLQRVLRENLGLPSDDIAEHQKYAEFDFVGKKVLLVEDNALNSEIATEILTEEGFIVDSANDGTVAVDKIKNASAGQYDIILMDVQMPEMDGYTATRLIRKLGTEISQIPIIAMTANAFEEDRKLAIDSGMNEHIAKPINIDILKNTIAKFL